MSKKGKIGPTVYADLDGATGEVNITIQCTISLGNQWKCPFGAFFTDPPEEGEGCQWHDRNSGGCALPRARLAALRRVRRAVTKEIDELEARDGCD